MIPLAANTHGKHTLFGQPLHRNNTDHYVFVSICYLRSQHVRTRQYPYGFAVNFGCRFSLISRAGHREQADAANDTFDLPDLGLGTTQSDAHMSNSGRKANSEVSNAHSHKP